jgi:hypothetical protein
MDVDIDFADRNDILNVIKHIPASLVDGRMHKTGIYCQEIPINPLTGNSAIDYKQAGDRGYFKIDLLNVNFYKDVRDENHLIELMNTEPLWDLLKQSEFVDLLFQLSGHADILKKNCPTSVEQLAAVLAMIRPAKIHLVGQDWNTILNEVWIKPTNGEYYWKKSHAFSYAIAVIIHMNLLCDHLSGSSTAP